MTFQPPESVERERARSVVVWFCPHCSYRAVEEPTDDVAISRACMGRCREQDIAQEDRQMVRLEGREALLRCPSCGLLHLELGPLRCSWCEHGMRAWVSR